MSGTPAPKPPIRGVERLLAGLLRYGAWTASAWIGLGLLLDLLSGAAKHPLLPIDPAMLMAIGLVLLIALPVLRISLLLVLFALERDYRFVLIAAVVLLVIALGFILGLTNPHFTGG